MSDKAQTEALRNLAVRSNDGYLCGPALAAADKIDAQAKRIDELEAENREREKTVQALYNVDGVRKAVQAARADALREALKTVTGFTEALSTTVTDFNVAGLQVPESIDGELRAARKIEVCISELIEGAKP
jgi:hypothetical protein